MTKLLTFVSSAGEGAGAAAEGLGYQLPFHDLKLFCGSLCVSVYKSQCLLSLYGRLTGQGVSRGPSALCHLSSCTIALRLPTLPPSFPDSLSCSKGQRRLPMSPGWS